MNVKPMHYSWPEFYDRVIDLTSYTFSWKAIANRYHSSKVRIPRWMNFIRAISSEGFGRLKYYREVRRRLDEDKPLIAFIGRLVGEKAADLLPDAISQSIFQHHGKANFLVLGSGEPYLEERLDSLKGQFNGYFNTYIGYSEPLSHMIYAGSDFLLMPSRVEPCGLNQMYALRYGTVPMVRSVGGLKDTIRDFGDHEGFGIRFDQPSVGDITYSVGRAIDLYTNKQDLYQWMRGYMMTIDHSWDSSAQQYIDLYQSLKN